jgi:hypothetical protein
MVKPATHCSACGGPVDCEGQTLVRDTRPPIEPPPPAAPARVVADDPLPHLSPVERFNQAIARRDEARGRTRR